MQRKNEEVAILKAQLKELKDKCERHETTIKNLTANLNAKQRKLDSEKHTSVTQLRKKLSESRQETEYVERDMSALGASYGRDEQQNAVLITELYRQIDKLKTDMKVIEMQQEASANSLKPPTTTEPGKLKLLTDLSAAKVDLANEQRKREQYSLRIKNLEAQLQLASDSWKQAAGGMGDSLPASAKGKEKEVVDPSRTVQQLYDRIQSLSAEVELAKSMSHAQMQTLHADLKNRDRKIDELNQHIKKVTDETELTKQTMAKEITHLREEVAIRERTIVDLQEKLQKVSSDLAAQQSGQEGAEQQERKIKQLNDQLQRVSSELGVQQAVNELLVTPRANKGVSTDGEVASLKKELETTLNKYNMANLVISAKDNEIRGLKTSNQKLLDDLNLVTYNLNLKVRELEGIAKANEPFIRRVHERASKWFYIAGGILEGLGGLITLFGVLSLLCHAGIISNVGLLSTGNVGLIAGNIAIVLGVALVGVGGGLNFFAGRKDNRAIKADIAAGLYVEGEEEPLSEVVVHPSRELAVSSTNTNNPTTQPDMIEPIERSALNANELIVRSANSKVTTTQPIIEPIEAAAPKTMVESSAQINIEESKQSVSLTLMGIFGTSSGTERLRNQQDSSRRITISFPK